MPATLLGTVLITIPLYLFGMLATGIGSRLAGRCATWCSALIGLPLWVVSGTVISFCTVLPQLTLAFLSSGLSITALAVGSAVAGAVTSLGLLLGICFLRRGGFSADAAEFRHKCVILLLASATLMVFVRGGTLSYTGTGLLMLLFVAFVLDNICCQYRLTYQEEIRPLRVHRAGRAERELNELALSDATMRFPAMSVFAALKNLLGVAVGAALLAGGALALLFGALALTTNTGTTQALVSATLISLGFCLPLLVEALHHPFGSIWKRFALACRIYPDSAFPMQLLNSAILSITLVLPLSSLMYRRRLPIGAQFRSYEIPLCFALGLVLLLPTLFGKKKRLYRAQGAVCLALYALYLAAALLAPLSGA